MRMKVMPSQDMLSRLLDYAPESGKFFWKRRPVSMFSDGAQSAAWNAAIWNGKLAGKEAFITKLSSGHRYASIYRIKFLAHRVAWKFSYGTEPDVIDHIDGDPSNNRLSNLRSVGQNINSRNSKLSKNNTSGFNGVYFDKRRGRYVARLMVNRKTLWLGAFDTAEKAADKVRETSALHGFHSNHGKPRAALVN